jgi:hypothetical protein
MEHVISAIKIFKLLLLQGEFNRREQAFLYSEYLEPEVQEVLSHFEEELSAGFSTLMRPFILCQASAARLLACSPARSGGILAAMRQIRMFTLHIT